MKKIEINKLINRLNNNLIEDYNLLGSQERFDEVFNYSLSKEEEDIHTVGYIMGVEYAIKQLTKLNK